MKGASIESARAAKEAAQRTFEKLGRVVGVGLISVAGGYGIKVNLESATDAELPSSIDGVPVTVDVVGKISKREL